MLFRCLAGKPAFHGETVPELVDSILHRDPDWTLLPKNLPPSVLPILLRCLAKSSVDRYRHIGDVRLDLDDALAARCALAIIGAGRCCGASFRGASPCSRGRCDRPIEHQLCQVERIFVDRSSTRHRVPDERVASRSERVALASRPMVRRRRRVQDRGGPGTVDAFARRRAVENARADTGRASPVLLAGRAGIGFYRNGHLYKRRLVDRGEAISLATTTNWYGESQPDNSLIYASSWGDPIARVSAAQHEAGHHADRRWPE